MRPFKLLVLVGVLIVAIVPSGCKKLKARDQLNKGVGAFRNAHFQAAINHFQTAVSLDPSLLNARLYLATAYAQQYVPGGESPENIKVGEQAINAFDEVLKMDPKNTSALASIAQIYYNMKKFDKAKEYQERRMQVEPNNPEPYYWIGVIDWALCYPKRMTLRKDLNLMRPKNPARPDLLPPLPNKASEQLAKENGPLIEEGMKDLEKAIALKPNYADAMAYLSLLYREKSDIETDKAAREADLKQADNWVQKSINLKKLERQKQHQAGATAS